MKKIAFVVASLCMFSCSTKKQVAQQETQETPQEVIKVSLKDDNTFLLHEVSKDATYGLSAKNPIQVGGVSTNEGPKNERRFLNALAGPKGEKVMYQRAGSCCAIESKNDPLGTGRVMLDNYRVTWEGSNDTTSIYINMYDAGSLKAPKGFTIKN